MSRPRILFLAHLLPWPLDGGGQIKSFHILRELAKSYDVHLLAYARPSDDVAAAKAALSPFCALGIETVPLVKTKARDAALALRSLLTGRSFLVDRDDTVALRLALARRLVNDSFAAIHVDHLQMMAAVPADTRGAAVVLDQHNVEHRIPERIAQTAGDSVKGRLKAWYAAGEASRLKRFETAALKRADLTLAVSDEDRAALSSMAPDVASRMVTLPIGVDTEYFAVADRSPDASRLLSIGTMYWPPNVDALLWFCADVLPKIRERLPDVGLDIVGARPTPQILALASERIRVTGTVPDVRPYANSCGVFIVPLRSGSGMRVKILNALSMGLPTVSTTVGAEGIDISDGTHLLLADSAEEFADACVRVLSDRALAASLGENGRRLMDQEYGWDAIGRRLREIYSTLPGKSSSRDTSLQPSQTPVREAA